MRKLPWNLLAEDRRHGVQVVQAERNEGLQLLEEPPSIEGAGFVGLALEKQPD